MEPKEKRAFEPTGLVPRSIVRTFERFRQQLLPGSERAAIREYRISRYQVLVSARCLFVLLTIPIASNWFVSSWLLSPIIEHFWNTQQNEVFLNSYQEERAFAELEFFSDKLFFESLLTSDNDNQNDLRSSQTKSSPKHLSPVFATYLKSPTTAYVAKTMTSTEDSLSASLLLNTPKSSLVHLGGNSLALALRGTGGKEVASSGSQRFHIVDANRRPYMEIDHKAANPKEFSSNFDEKSLWALAEQNEDSSMRSSEQFMGTANIKTNSTENSLKIKERIQEKILELAVYYNQQTILSITNIAGDFISVFTLGCLFIWMKPEISILKSFLIEAIYSLSDTTKSFLLILLTDLLVGFHSPRGWETALELLLKHFGLPENQDFVFLFVATFPVLLDTVFKYWIFRHLNKISPSTVATYHSMIE